MPAIRYVTGQVGDSPRRPASLPLITNSTVMITTIAQNGISFTIDIRRSRVIDWYCVHSAPPPNCCETRGKPIAVGTRTAGSSSSTTFAFFAAFLLPIVRASAENGNSRYITPKAIAPIVSHSRRFHSSTPSSGSVSVFRSATVQ